VSIKYISLCFGVLSVGCALGALYYRFEAVKVRVRKELRQGVLGMTPEEVVTFARLHRAARLTRAAVGCAIVAAVLPFAFTD
jgi:hypothetical protein